MTEDKKTTKSKTAICCRANSSEAIKWMVLGAGIGTALGVSFGNVAVGVAFGPGLGMLFGMYLDKRKRAEKAGSLD